jgi:hypothetical protein
VSLASVPKEAYMGMAASSYWLIGGKPSKSSVELTATDEVYHRPYPCHPERFDLPLRGKIREVGTIL